MSDEEADAFWAVCLPIAQAMVEGIPLVTSDETISKYPVKVMW